MQEIRSSNFPMVTGICDPNNSRAWHHRRFNICVGCFEISIDVIAKSIRIIRAFYLLGGDGDDLRFSVPGGTEEIAGWWFARGRQ